MDNINEKYLIREKLKQQVKEKQGWYFINFVRELPSDRPYGFTLFKEPFVLFKDRVAGGLAIYCRQQVKKMLTLLFPLLK